MNKQQREAVELLEGPILIVAGAGSGKTLVLTYRIANLISKGVNPSEILALTFTNKAANEMKERVKNLVGKKSVNIVIGTFHSIFARILRSESRYIDFTKNFTIYDEDDSLSLIKNILNDLNISSNLLNPRIVKAKISNAKNKLILPENYDKFFFGFPEDKIHQIYSEYQK
ncbi:MAG: UvrD-helicase domain-containing protein, partial [Ignavibacteria bacterium]|nr:UvrD-helicase domain-containing protein [Ignavibacteria bacterium]